MPTLDFRSGIYLPTASLRKNITSDFANRPGHSAEKFFVKIAVLVDELQGAYNNIIDVLKAYPRSSPLLSLNPSEDLIESNPSIYQQTLQIHCIEADCMRFNFSSSEFVFE